MGFRWKVHQIVLATGGLCGFVRNLGDGRVELVLDGSLGRIEDALSRVDDHFAGFITTRDLTWEQPSSSNDGFLIER